MRMPYSDKEILLFDDGTVGAFRHVKPQLDVVAAHTCFIGQNFFDTIGSVLGTNFSPHDWETFTYYRCKLAEHFESFPDLKHDLSKHKDLIKLIKLTFDVSSHHIVPETYGYVNTSIFTNGKRGCTKNVMFVDNNMPTDF